MLYQNQVDPRFQSPLLQQYSPQPTAAGGGGGGLSGMNAAQPPRPMQTQGAGGGMNPMQMATNAMRIKNMVGGQGGSSAAGSSSSPGSGLMSMLGGGGEGTGVAGAEGAAGGGAEGAGMLGGMGGMAWMAPVAAAAIMSGVALNEGEKPSDVFGGKGWGAYPFKSAEAIGEGDFKGAMGHSLKGGGGPVSYMGDMLNGGNSEDYLHSTLGPIKGLWDYFSGDDDDTMDLISVFSNVWG